MSPGARPAGERPTIVLAAALAHRPARGGHAWVVLNWLLGLRRLGFRPLLLDRLDPSMLGVGPDSPRSAAAALGWVHRVLDPYGLGGDVAVLGPEGVVLEGPDRGDLLATARGAVGLLDVMGFCGDDDVLAAVPRTVGIDIDPGFGQLWTQLGLADPFGHHDEVVTVGTAVGTPGCRVPDLGRTWHTTLPPVVLEHWPTRPPGPPVVSSVGAWRGPYGPLELDGRRAGLRVHAARPLVDLPSRVDATFRFAWELDAADDADRRELERHGWELLDPIALADTPEAYRELVAAAGVELCVAKEIYSITRSGWFSDRSAVYLASGRPVVMSDTGLPAELPTGKGLLVADGPDATAAALADVLGDLPGHSRAAREWAEEHLDADRVLADLLDRLGLR
jgi:hypothetical protein